MWIASCDDTAAAGAAAADGQVGTVESETGGGYAINVRCFYRWVTIAADILLRDVIRDEEDEVWF